MLHVLLYALSTVVQRAVKGEKAMINILAVGIGGFMGAVSRYAAGSAIVGYFAAPAATFFINAAGSLLIGVVSVTAQRYAMAGHPAVLLLQAGFCGGFTTFSTFSLEMFTLMAEGRPAMAAAYAAASVLCCIACVAAGRAAMNFMI